MPEHRSFPWKYIPRVGVKLSVTFGDPLLPQDIQVALRALSRQDRYRHANINEAPEDGVADDGEYRLFGIDYLERVRERVARESISMETGDESRKRKTDYVRSMITAVVQQSVEAVGRRISGNTLGKKVNG